MLFKRLGLAVSLGALPYLANAKDVPEVCHKPLANALICHDNGVYDCIKEERLYVCGEGSCYFFQSGPKCAPPGFDAFEPGALDDLGNATSSDTVNDYPGFEEARGARTRTTTSESTSSASCTADTSTVTVISWVSWNNSVSSSSSADSSSGSDAKFLSSRATSASTAPSTLTTLLTVKTMIGPSNSSASSSETTSSSSLSTAATKRSVLGDTSGPEDSVELKNGIGVRSGNTTGDAYTNTSSSSSSPGPSPYGSHLIKHLVNPEVLSDILEPANCEGDNFYPTICHEHGIYDCINKKMLEKCDGGDYDCQTFMSGARCVPLWIGGEYAPIRPTSTTSATSGSVTSTAPAGSSTYSPQRLCNAANEPDDPTLKLYTDPDVETVCGSEFSTFNCRNGIERSCDAIGGAFCCAEEGKYAKCCYIPGGKRRGMGNESWAMVDGRVYATSLGNSTMYPLKGTPQSKYDHDRWYLALSRGASFNPDAVPQLEDPGYLSFSSINSSTDLGTTSTASSTGSTSATVTTTDSSSSSSTSSSSTSSSSTSSSSNDTAQTTSNSLLDDIKHIGSEVVGIVKDVADNITSSEL